VDRVTGLVGALEHPEAAAAASEHLGHERQVVQRAAFVEGREDLRGSAHLDHLSDLQTKRSLEGHLLTPANFSSLGRKKCSFILAGQATGGAIRAVPL